MSEPIKFDEKPYINLLECYKTYMTKVVKPSMEKSGIRDTETFEQVKKLHENSIATCIDALKHIDKTKIEEDFNEKFKEKINECIVTPMQSFLTVASRIVNRMDCIFCNCSNDNHTWSVFPIEIEKYFPKPKEEEDNEEEKKLQSPAPLYGHICIAKFKEYVSKFYNEFRNDYAKWVFPLRDGTTCTFNNVDVYAKVYCPEALTILKPAVKEAKGKSLAKAKGKAKK